MTNAFETLSISPRLTLGEEELRDAFREAGKTAHPDGGGDTARFEQLRAAFETLSSPAQRLIHWLACRDIPVDTRGTIDTRLMDLFGTVGTVSHRAGELARKRATARTALGLALLENETQSCLEAVESAISLVDQAITEETNHFEAMECGQLTETDAISRCARNLLFLEKWRKTLRSIPPTLI
jgi:curved DNA-binding protein CbpA